LPLLVLLFVIPQESASAVAVVLSNQPQKNGCPIHRGLIAMSGNEYTQPTSLCFAVVFALAVAVVCPFVCHPVGICFCLT
jgi:hypothetical protein